MIEILEPLAQLAGVRVVALVTHDGVPVAIPGKAADVDNDTMDDEVPFTDGEALSALSIGLLDELSRGMGLLSGGAPNRVILKAARGTLVMMPAAGAVLVAVLRGGMNPEELRLPMDGAAARIQRILRGMGGSRSAPTPLPTDNPSVVDPPGLFPNSVQPMPEEQAN